MKLTMFAQFGKFGRQAWWSGAAIGLLLVVGATATGDVTKEAKQRGSASRFFSLFSAPNATLQANQLQCGINNAGEICKDLFDSPTGGGGFWPTGSVNQYIFNTGLQMAGIHSADAGPWANDTVAAYFFDASGGGESGSPLTNIFDSNNPDDLANWPAAAFIQDTELFDPVLIGLKTASQQDSWVQYWDGNPLVGLANRSHPIGVRATQRSLAWNFPAGNESVIYFIYDFENVTDEADFQNVNEAQFFGGANGLPDAGFAINEMYAAFSTDMDISSSATTNLSTAILPFDIGLSYEGAFAAPEFVYPPNLFFPPFFLDAPGIVGVKYLQSPIDQATGQQVGLTLFSNTQNPGNAQFPDPAGDKQLFRYLSGKLDPAQGDEPCNVPADINTGNPATTQRTLCFILQTSADTRFYQSSGPFTLEAGQTTKIVVAYIVAATVKTLPDGSPSGILANNLDSNANPPGVPSFHPGFDSGRDCDPDGTGCTVFRSAAENVVLPIERGAGWIQYNGPAPGGAVETLENKLSQFDIDVVPGSLLGRGLVAQTIFDNKFLLGFSPEAPPFFLVADNNAVTIVWEPSTSEAQGDPFFAVASDAGSALFNPNFRGVAGVDPHGDIEGYRVWRGTNPANLELIAQFDYDDTSFLDFTCETVRSDEDMGTTALVNGVPTPVVGFVAGETCGIGAGGLVRSTTSADLVFNNGSDGGPPGAGMVRAVDLRAIPSGTDTLGVTGTAATLRITNSGIPFVFSDFNVLNNFTYFYSVSAFDLNSQASGPVSLRSTRPTQFVVPRGNAPNLQLAEFQLGLQGDDGEFLDLNQPSPLLDSETGQFSGPMPPTDAYTQGFAPAVLRLLPAFIRAATIDSIVAVHGPGSAGAVPTAECPVGGHAFSVCYKQHMTLDVSGTLTSFVIDGYMPWWNAFTEPTVDIDQRVVAADVDFDAGALRDYGVPAGPGTTGKATVDVHRNEAITFSANQGPQNRRFGNRHGGSRWFDGANESTPDPTRFMRAGHLAGVDTVFAVVSHTPFGDGTPNPNSFEKQCFNRGMGSWGRAADIQMTWSGGTVTVRDVTHNVDVPFSPFVRPGWGFLTADGSGDGVIAWNDFNYTSPTFDVIETSLTGGDCNADAANDDLGDPSQTVMLTDTPSLVATSTLGMDTNWASTTFTQTGTGFGLYINSERYIFEMAALPADGTVWTLRTYAGAITSNSDADDTNLDPGGYSFLLSNEPGPAVGGVGPARLVRPSLIPGLTFAFKVENPTAVGGTADLTLVHTVPDPYLGTSNFDLSPTTKQLMFVNLPVEATIRIYSLTGKLVSQVEHSDQTGGGRVVWDMRNRNNQFVASGVYFFHVVTPAGDEHVGKMTIVNFAGQN